jgi:hypothetical protein
MTMIKNAIAGAIALAFSTSAFAAEVPAPKPECACCKKTEDGKMACCEKHEADGQHGADHHSHTM